MNELPVLLNMSSHRISKRVVQLRVSIVVSHAVYISNLLGAASQPSHHACADESALSFDREM